MTKKLLAFDLDGTLSSSRSPMHTDMAEILALLLDTHEICVISGGDFAQFQIQILDILKVGDDKLAKLHLMPTCGTRYYRFDGGWREIYAENFTEEQKTTIIGALTKAVDDLGYAESKSYGKTIEDRGSQITYSALGQGVVTELGEEGVRLKEAWDPDGTKKERLRQYVLALIPEFEVRAGGTTSIDITKPGIDKAYGMRRLMALTSVAKADILFFGDKIQPGGNDFPVREMGIESVEVTDWRDTLSKLREYREGYL